MEKPEALSRLAVQHLLDIHNSTVLMDRGHGMPDTTFNYLAGRRCRSYAIRPSGIVAFDEFRTRGDNDMGSQAFWTVVKHISSVFLSEYSPQRFLMPPFSVGSKFSFETRGRHSFVELSFLSVLATLWGNQIFCRVGLFDCR